MSGYIDDATLQQVEQSLQQGGLYVAPELTAALPADQVAAFTAARTTAPTPVYALALSVDYDDPTYHGNVEALIATIRDDTGLDGLFLAVEPAEEGTYRMTSVAYPSTSGDYAIGSVADAEHPRDIGAMLLDAVALAKSGDASQRLDEIWADSHTSTTGADGRSEDGGMSTGASVGIVAALAVVATVLVAGVRSSRRQRAASGATTAQQPFALPRTVLTTVRAAEDERNARQAQTDVLALGEAIDAASMGRRLSPAAARAWQSALDHYDVSRRILDREHTPADVVGAIVLARRGRSALVAARGGKGWAPPQTCYFNPLHSGSTTSVQWGDGDVSVSVPACRACAFAVSAGRTPEDVLDFVAKGRPRHYFKLDLGVWSDTGYGALDPDLLGRLFRA